MSLKNFHLLFISAAVLLALACAVLAVGHLREGLAPRGVAALVVSVAAAGFLVRYEAGFLRQCRARGIR